MCYTATEGGAPMTKMIPLKKQSKKAQKEHARTQRTIWAGVKPVLRVVESRKRYSRKRMADADRAAREGE